MLARSGIATAAEVRLPSQGLAGHLDLICSLDDRGESHLSRQSFRAPFHVSKPHRDAGMLVVNLASTSPGLLAGDFLTGRVAVEAGAQLLLTTPAATRAHTMPRGGAELRQEFAVAGGGWLEVWPELFIPHKGARYRQRTLLQVEEGGEALLFEAIAPGRVASGEAFAFEELCWATDVFLGRCLVARERYRLTPQLPAVAAVRRVFPEAYYGSCHAITERLDTHEVSVAIEQLQSPDAWVGCSRLRAGGLVIKVAASGSVALRRTLSETRQVLHAALKRSAPSLRRVQPIG